MGGSSLCGGLTLRCIPSHKGVSLSMYAELKAKASMGISRNFHRVFVGMRLSTELGRDGSLVVQILAFLHVQILFGRSWAVQILNNSSYANNLSDDNDDVVGLSGFRSASVMSDSGGFLNEWRQDNPCSWRGVFCSSGGGSDGSLVALVLITVSSGLPKGESYRATIDDAGTVVPSVAGKTRFAKAKITDDELQTSAAVTGQSMAPAGNFALVTAGSGSRGPDSVVGLGNGIGSGRYKVTAPMTARMEEITLGWSVNACGYESLGRPIQMGRPVLGITAMSCFWI